MGLFLENNKDNDNFEQIEKTKISFKGLKKCLQMLIKKEPENILKDKRQEIRMEKNTEDIKLKKIMEFIDPTEDKNLSTFTFPEFVDIISTIQSENEGLLSTVNGLNG